MNIWICNRGMQIDVICAMCVWCVEVFNSNQMNMNEESQIKSSNENKKSLIFSKNSETLKS